MKLHHITHVNCENIGVIGEWAKAQRMEITGSKPYSGDTLPDCGEFDFLVVMGGPQSAVELEKHPYLEVEVNLIREAIDQGKYVLGFCLGAQLIGQALGTKASKSPEKEIGVFPIELTQAGQQDRIFSLFPKEFEVMHWHSDMPGIADSAELLAKSAGCPQQAFSYGEKVYGLQFHIEIERASLIKMIERFSSDLTPNKFVQSKEDMLSKNIEAINEYVPKFLNAFIQGE